MPATINSVSTSSILTSLVSTTVSRTTDSTEEESSTSSATTTDISDLIDAVEDSVSIISRIVGADDDESGSEDTTYSILLSAQSVEVMKTCPAFVRDILSANESGDDGITSVNLVTMDTGSLVSMLEAHTAAAETEATEAASAS